MGQAQQQYGAWDPSDELKKVRDRMSRRAHLSAQQREILEKLDIDDLDAERIAEQTDGFDAGLQGTSLARDVARMAKRGDLVAAYRMLREAPASKYPDARHWADSMVAAARGPRIDLSALFGSDAAEARTAPEGDDGELLRVVWGVRAILKDNINRYLDQDGRDWCEFLGDVEPDTGERRVDHVAPYKVVRDYMAEAREVLGPDLDVFR